MRRLSALLPFALLACARPSTATLAARPAVPTVRYVGAVRFEARHPTAHGASRETDTRPARFVEVVAFDANDHVTASTFTDAEGRFALDAPAGTPVIAARAKLTHDGHEVVVSPTGDATVVHAHRVERPVAGSAIELVARDADADGVAGALHIADTVYRGVAAARAWTGRTLPAGGLLGPGRHHRVELLPRRAPGGLGALPPGAARRRAAAAVEHRHRRARRGDHPPRGGALRDGHALDELVGGRLAPSGFLIDPGLAWEEGRATWFSSAVRRDPLYQDTIGLEPGGSLRVDHDLERGDFGPAGLGSEASVASVLWDLTDGAEDTPTPTTTASRSAPRRCCARCSRCATRPTRTPRSTASCTRSPRGRLRP
ncbi:MAG: hypothetical protein R3A52_04630 [Polyangiales bacterium]